MRIAEFYSHLNGYEYLQYTHANRWQEIEQVIAAVDASRYRTKISKEKTMTGRELYDPRALNLAFKAEFKARQWDDKGADFSLHGTPNLFAKPCTLLLPNKRR